jgi:5-methylcytosine-specific restriction enzyme subunit McrC
MDVATIDSTELVDLFGSVLASGMRNLMRRGLKKDYLLVNEDIAGIRGRVNIGTTARKMLIQHGQANCEFDELSVDCLPNQIILATLRNLLRSKLLNKKIRTELRKILRELAAVSAITITKKSFRTVQLNGNNRAYRFLLHVCELILDLSLISEEPGEFSFRDFVKDERRMARLFENFVFNYLKLRHTKLSVTREHIQWQATSGTDPALTYLPGMRTDISVRFPEQGRTLIIDTKFYKETFQTHYDRESIHSANLYQIFSYIKNLEINGGPDRIAEGLLLYPVIDKSVRQTYEMPGHKIHINTLNLSADWNEIEGELDMIVSNEI